MPTNLTPEQLIAEARTFQSGWPKLSIDRLVGQLADALASAQQRIQDADAKNHRLFELRVQAELRADRAEQRIQELEVELLDTRRERDRLRGILDTTIKSTLGLAP